MNEPSSTSSVVWNRALEGKSSVLLGAPLPPLPEEPHRLVRIDCAAWNRPLGPMLELRQELGRLIEETRAPVTLVGEREKPPEAYMSYLMQVVNRLQRQLDCPLIVVLEAIHLADQGTLHLLEEMLESPGQLLAAFVLQTDQPTLDGAVGSMMERLQGTFGETATISAAADRPEKAPALSEDLKKLPADILRVLRAAAVVGDTFEADLVGGLLGVDPYMTLELLQIAIDAGVALEDRGQGIFRLPEGMGAALRAGTTPSLAAAWHADLAMMMNMHREEADELDAALPAREAPGIGRGEERGAERVGTLKELATKWQGRDLTSRGAEHAEAAGERHSAALRYVAAAEEASAIGGHGRAIELVERAVRLLPVSPASDEERRLLVRVLLAMGRVLWRGAGTDSDATLDHALQPLQRARQLLVSADEPEVRAEIGAQIAKVAYDIGDPAHFRLALDVLHESQQVLLDDGRPLGAARLLNEEAAVLIRTGELRQAAELLARSRDVFLRHADRSTEARRELAQTDHLVARLPLHEARGGRDEPSLAFALDCARNAERVYVELDDAREHARVQETLGRLTRMSGRREEAQRLLEHAFVRQREIGDAIGLARTTAALAELLADVGLPEDAVSVLSDSVSLNLQLGSRQGVIYNLRGLDDLERTLGNISPDLAGVLGEMRSRLETAAAQA